MNKENKLEFFIPKKENGLGQWLAEEGISAGFPSPADDFKETRISLDRELVKNKEATFYARVSGDSMIGALEITSLTFMLVCVPEPPCASPCRMKTFK